MCSCRQTIRPLKSPQQPAAAPASSAFVFAASPAPGAATVTSVSALLILEIKAACSMHGFWHNTLNSRLKLLCYGFVQEWLGHSVGSTKTPSANGQQPRWPHAGGTPPGRGPQSPGEFAYSPMDCSPYPAAPAPDSQAPPASRAAKQVRLLGLHVFMQALLFFSVVFRIRVVYVHKVTQEHRHDMMLHVIRGAMHGRRMPIALMCMRLPNGGPHGSPEGGRISGSSAGAAAGTDPMSRKHPHAKHCRQGGTRHSSRCAFLAAHCYRAKVVCRLSLFVRHVESLLKLLSCQIMNPLLMVPLVSSATNISSLVTKQACVQKLRRQGGDRNRNPPPFMPMAMSPQRHSTGCQMRLPACTSRSAAATQWRAGGHAVHRSLSIPPPAASRHYPVRSCPCCGS